jgi:hypothetical protein
MTDDKDKPSVPEGTVAPKTQEDKAGPDREDANAREDVTDMVEQIETPSITGL